jgi:recombination protein RecT
MGKALVKAKSETILDVLNANKAKLAQVVAKGVTPERLIRVVMGAIQRNPAIAECTPLSVCRVVMEATVLGLEAGDPLGEAYIVPYRNNKTGNKEAQLIVGYQGLVSLAYRHPDVISVQAGVVCEGDEFDYSLGSGAYVKHRKAAGHEVRLEGAAGELFSNVRYAWAVVCTRGGGMIVNVLTANEIESHKHRSRAAGSGPWVTDYGPMCRKTVLRDTLRLCPRNRQLEQALALEQTAEAGQYSEDVIDLGEVEVVKTEPPQSQKPEVLTPTMETLQPESEDTGADGSPAGLFDPIRDSEIPMEGQGNGN